MSTLQTDRAAWKNTRVGKFTASTIGKLMAEPRAKAAQEAGEFSEGAKTLIAQKATERIKGHPIHTPSNYSMRRGTLLEHAATNLLSTYWKQIDQCTYMDYGTNAGATPDGLVAEPLTPTVDIKCKEDETDLLLFADSVPDNDFAALKSWNRDEAYQVAMQARAAGTTRGYLIYFTDKMHTVSIPKEEADECNNIMEWIGEKLFTLTGRPHEYRLNAIEGRYGFAFIARGFDIPAEEFDRIDRVLERAEVECMNMVERFRMHLSPSKEQVERTRPIVA